MSFILLCILLIFGSIRNFIFLVDKFIEIQKAKTEFCCKLQEKTNKDFDETLENFNNINYISKKSYFDQHNISYFPNEILFKILGYVKDKKTRRSFKYVSKNFERCRRQIFFKYRIKKQIKAILLKKFKTKTRITFEQLHKKLNIFLSSKKIQDLLNTHPLFRYYFTKYFIRNHLIYNKKLDCFLDRKCIFLEKIIEKLRNNLDYKKIIFSYNDKNYFLEILPCQTQLYLQCNYNNKWQIFYGEDWDYFTEERAQILKDKKITEIAVISNIVSSNERMYSPASIDDLLSCTQKNQVKRITEAVNRSSYRCKLKGFVNLKKICLRGPTQYKLDFDSLHQLREISYTVKTQTAKKEYGGKTVKKIRLAKFPEKNRINDQKIIYSTEINEWDPYFEESILEYVVMKVNSTNS